MAKRLRRRQDDDRAARPADPSLRNHRNRQRELALQEPRLSRRATPACPGGQTGTSHARRSVAREGTARPARVPPIRYRDKPVPTPVRGSLLHADRGPDCVPFDTCDSEFPLSIPVIEIVVAQALTVSGGELTVARNS